MQTFEVKFDFERLRTNIDSQDMQDSIMHMVREIFAVKEHEGFVGIKVRTKSHAQWLKQSPIPACNRDRFSDKDGESVTFDVLCIEEWLTYLSRNMYVTFGRIVKRQVQGTPRGTNCASNLANILLAWYELCFLRNLSSIISDASQSTVLQNTARRIFHAFLLTGRYIADLLSINNPCLKLLLYNNQHPFFPAIDGIYPPSLSFACASACRSAPFWTSLSHPPLTQAATA